MFNRDLNPSILVDSGCKKKKLGSGLSGWGGGVKKPFWTLSPFLELVNAPLTNNPLRSLQRFLSIPLTFLFAGAGGMR